MKKQKNILKVVSIIIGAIAINLAIVIGLLFMLGKYNKYEITTDKSKYVEVIGENAINKYKDKWGMSEEIFPKDINNLNVLDFKMVYFDPFDKQYLAYLVVDYDDD